MAERQNWPAWRYGPNGEARIFKSASEVPEGWGKHPTPAAPATEQQSRRQPEEDQDEDELRRVREEKARDELEEARRVIAGLREEVNRLRKENTRLQEKAATGTPLPQREQSETPQSVRRPRKLSTAKEPEAAGTPFTPKDDTVTVDEGRAERLAVLHAADVEISDDATDGEIEAALDWLEKQTEKG